MHAKRLSSAMGTPSIYGLASMIGIPQSLELRKGIEGLEKL
jgi:hypothetical protein